MRDDFTAGWDAAVAAAASAHAEMTARLNETRDCLDRALTALRLLMPLAEDEAVYAAYRVEFDAAEALLARRAPTGEPGAGAG